MEDDNVVSGVLRTWVMATAEGPESLSAMEQQLRQWLFWLAGESGDAEGLGADETPKTTGDFLLDFDHADIVFGQIVIEGCREIGDEGEYAGAALAQAVEQVGGRRIFGTPSGGHGPISSCA